MTMARQQVAGVADPTAPHGVRFPSEPTPEERATALEARAEDLLAAGLAALATAARDGGRVRGAAGAITAAREMFGRARVLRAKGGRLSHQRGRGRRDRVR